MFIKTITLLALTATIMAQSRTFPIFLQCDDSWKNELIGSSGKTICDARKDGSLINSIAMLLNGYG